MENDETSNSDKVIYEKPDENEHSGSAIGNTTLFQGREYEPETKLYYYRARYFDPQLGRFLQPDPKGYIDSTNLYSSFNQNPVNFSDPMGTKTDFNYYGTKKTYGEALNDLKVGKLLAGRLRRVFEGAANMGLGLLQWAYDIGSYTTFNPMMMQRQKNYSLNFSREGSVLRSEPRDTSFKELAKDLTVLPRIGEFLGNFTANVYSGYFDKYVKGTPVGQDAREDVDRGIVPFGAMIWGTIKGVKGKTVIKYDKHHWWPKELRGADKKGAVVKIPSSNPNLHTAKGGIHPNMRIYFKDMFGTSTWKAAKSEFFKLDFNTQHQLLQSFYKTQGLNMPTMINRGIIKQ